MVSPHQYRQQDPVVTSVLSDGSEPLILHIHYVNHTYNIGSGDGSLKLIAQSHPQSQSNASLILCENKRDTINHELAHCQFTDKARLNDVGFKCDTSGIPSALWWSDVQYNTPFSIQYRFTAAIHLPSQVISDFSEAWRPRVFTWKNKSRLMLVDEETDTVAAIFEDVKTDSTKCGTLQVLVPFDDNFYLTALTSFLAVYERLNMNYNAE